MSSETIEEISLKTWCNVRKYYRKYFPETTRSWLAIKSHFFGE